VSCTTLSIPVGGSGSDHPRHPLRRTHATRRVPKVKSLIEGLANRHPLRRTHATRRGLPLHLWVSWLWLCLLATGAQAHEMRPSLIELTELEGGQVDVVWKVAFALGAPMPLTLHLDPRCQPLETPKEVRSETVLTRRWRADCGEEGLIGAALSVDGLGRTGTDVIVQVHLLDGSLQSSVLNGKQPGTAIVAADAREENTLPVYAWLGIEHILGGYDHLLFVLGLLLVVGPKRRMLLWTITSFTAGHSITLALASLGFFPIQSTAVEAIIALTILMLAVELARDQADNPVFLMENPWAAAFGCGLLHGLGFAGVLSNLGLSSEALAPALLLFNLGVEAGQLAFVLFVLALRVLVPQAMRKRLETSFLPTFMGAVASYWLIARTISMVR